MWGPTIMLCVPSEAAQQALQTELNKPLMEALRESAEQDIFPAFKIVEMKPKTEEQPEETYPRFSPAKSPAKSPANETMQGQLPIPATMPPEQDHFQSGQNRPLLDPETHLNKNATFDTFVPAIPTVSHVPWRWPWRRAPAMISIRCVSTAAPAWAKPIC